VIHRVAGTLNSMASPWSVIPSGFKKSSSSVSPALHPEVDADLLEEGGGGSPPAKIQTKSL